MFDFVGDKLSPMVVTAVAVSAFEHLLYAHNLEVYDLDLCVPAVKVHWHLQRRLTCT